MHTASSQSSLVDRWGSLVIGECGGSCTWTLAAHHHGSASEVPNRRGVAHGGVQFLPVPQRVADIASLGGTGREAGRPADRAGSWSVGQPALAQSRFSSCECIELVGPDPLAGDSVTP